MFCIVTARSTCNREEPKVAIRSMVAGTGTHHSGGRLTGARLTAFCSAAQRQATRMKHSFYALCSRRDVLRRCGLYNSTSPHVRSESCEAFAPNSGKFAYRSPQVLKRLTAAERAD